MTKNHERYDSKICIFFSSHFLLKKWQKNQNMTKSLLKYLTTIINWPLFSISEQSEKFLLFCRNVPINSHCTQVFLHYANGHPHFLTSIKESNNVDASVTKINYLNFYSLNYTSIYFSKIKKKIKYKIPLFQIHILRRWFFEIK